MYYVKHYSQDQSDEVLGSFNDFDDALKYECELINKGTYDKNSLCIEDFLR